MKKIYIDNSRFMEFIDEMATQITEMNYGQDSWIDVKEGVAVDNGMRFSDEAQEYYNEMYSEYETMANNMMGVYKHHDMIMHIYPNKTK